MSFQSCREISFEQMTKTNVISSDPDIFSGWYREQVKRKTLPSLISLPKSNPPSLKKREGVLRLEVH